METYSRVAGAATAAVNSAVHGVFGGGDPAITEEMSSDASTPPAWKMMRAGRYGTKAFVDGLKTVCKTLQAKGLDRPMEIGDISRKYGGPIGGHKSHRVGKDVDVYFVTDAKGRFDPVWNMRVAGVAVGTYAKVTHIFVDQRLKSLMESTYRSNADAIPADERANVQKALQIMSHWPGHDNHFHIRTDYNVHPGDDID
jgi:murein endopeptidase